MLETFVHYCGRAVCRIAQTLQAGKRTVAAPQTVINTNSAPTAETRAELYISQPRRIILILIHFIVLTQVLFDTSSLRHKFFGL